MILVFTSSSAFTAYGRKKSRDMLGFLFTTDPS